MIEPLYDHQKKIIAEDKKKFGLFLGTGGGKTRTALELAEGKILVICPKQQFLDKTWEKNAEKFGIKKTIKVISKEWLKNHKEEWQYYDTIIIDECHKNLGVSHQTRQRNKVQIPKTSDIFEATLELITMYPPKRLYLCSATPVTKPMQMWAIGILFGEKWSFFQFREKYYFPVKMGFRQEWLPRKDEGTQQRLALLVQRYGYTGSLNDFADVPEQTHLMPPEIEYIDLTDEQKHALKELSNEEADPLVRRARQRTIENGVLYGKKVEQISDREDRLVKDTKIFPSGKIDYIVEKAAEFPKLLIFANYTAQIEEIAKALRAEGYKVSTLTGATKDRKTVIEDAENDSAHIVVAQSSISSGYELPSFPCVIYASKSWQYVDYEQSLGRVLRINKLKKNLYIHLVVKGGPDEGCHDAIMLGTDFQEKLSVL